MISKKEVHNWENTIISLESCIIKNWICAPFLVIELFRSKFSNLILQLGCLLKNLWDTCRFMHVHVLSLNFFKLGSIWAVVCCWNHFGYQRWHKVRLHKIYTLKYPIYSKLSKYKSCWNGSKIEYMGGVKMHLISLKNILMCWWSITEGISTSTSKICVIDKLP